MADLAEKQRRQLLYELNHVFLPPKTPQKDDTSNAADDALTDNLLGALTSFQETLPSPKPRAVGVCVRMLERMLCARLGHSDLDPKRIVEEIGGLQDKECFLLHLRAQNAGMLVSGRPDSIIFETFELLAANKDVMSCKGRLIRYFPATATAIKRSVIDNTDLLAELARVLVELDLYISPAGRPVTKKSESLRPETRDAVLPTLVTSMLPGIFRAVGQDVPVVRIQKHSREQLNWHDDEKCWHRAAAWLLLKVGVQLVLDREETEDQRSLMPASSRILVYCWSEEGFERIRRLKFAGYLCCRTVLDTFQQGLEVLVF